MAAVLKEHPESEFGAPALKRHKRRRTNAYNPRKQFKRPRIAASKQGQAVHPREAGTSSDLPQSKAQQPVKNTTFGGEQHSSSQLEHLPAVVARYELGTNRRMRRDHPELLQYHHSLRDPDEPPIPRCLPTHAFLCKRFVMKERAGWKLPVHTCGKGHRKHTLKHAMLSSAVLEDRSHWPKFAIKGQNEVVGAILSDLLAPQPFLRASKPDSFSTSENDATENEECKQFHSSSAYLQRDGGPQRQHDADTAKVSSDFQAYIRRCCVPDGRFLISSWLVDTKHPTHTTTLVSPCLLDVSHPEGSFSETELPDNTNVMQEAVQNDQEDSRAKEGSGAEVGNDTKEGMSVKGDSGVVPGGVVAVIAVHPAAERVSEELLVRVCSGKAEVVNQASSGPPSEAVWRLTGLCAEQVVQRAFAFEFQQQSLDPEHEETLFHALVR